VRVASRQAQDIAQARADAILAAFGIAPRGTVSGAAYGGAFVPAPSGPELKTYNPASGEVLAGIRTAGLDDLAAASAATHHAFLRWRTVPAPRRGEIVRRLGEAFRERKEDLARLISLENGKILGEARGEVQEVIDICDFAVGLSRQLYGNQMHSERPGHRLTEQWHPLGVVGIISAFNFPVAVPGWGWALALVCGDAVLWKPSSLTPLISIAAQQVFHEVTAGTEAEGVFGLAIGSGGTVGEALLADPLYLGYRAPRLRGAAYDAFVEAKTPNLSSIGPLVRAQAPSHFTFASHAYPDFHLLMPLYVCRKWSGIVTPREGQRLAWVRPARLADYPMPPADKPLVAMLRDLL